MKAHRRLYLARYAAPEAAAVPSLSRDYRFVLSIPAFDEPEDFLERTLPADAGDLLVVLVANVPDRVDPRDPSAVRTRGLRRLAGRYDAARNIDVVLIDRTDAPIPTRFGVGLARRIGADVALRYLEERRIEVPILFCTDADAALPHGYFEACATGVGSTVGTGARWPGGRATAAWVYPFTHTSPNPALRGAALGYELSLRYYVNRLAYAGSPYAFHTLGSCLAIDATAYAMVRGFPKRNAAEDFYVLNKLAKVGRIRCLAEPVIELEGRASNRVPFGTGPALAAAPADVASRMGYAPETFEALRTLHDCAAAGAWAALPDPLPSLLAAIGHARFRPSKRDARAFHTWFDAFRTVKFVHAARAQFPDVPLLESLRALFPKAATPADLNRALRADETRQPDFRGLVDVAGP